MYWVIAVLSVQISLLLLSIVMAWRNLRVFKYRTELLRLIGIEADRDIRHLRPWRWRYAVLQAVPYNRMLFKFWKPLRSFFPDRSFIEPSLGGEGTWGDSNGSEPHSFSV